MKKQITLLLAAIILLLNISAMAVPNVTASMTDDLLIDNDVNSLVTPGDVIRYTIIIQNSGNMNAINVAFMDVLDYNSTLIVGSVTTTVGTVSSGNNAGDNNVNVDIGVISPGITVTVIIDVSINSPFPLSATIIANQGLVTGDNFNYVLTDDPDGGGFQDPTVTPVVNTVYDGNFELKKQSEVNDFIYINITGSLSIEEKNSGNIIDLTPLSTLTSVGGDLQISNNTALTILDGLNSITSVGGDLYVENNNTLNSFCGLFSLLNDGFVGNYFVSGNAVNPTQEVIISGGACPIKIKIKIYLEGPYSSSNHNMNTSISNIPLNSPYAQDPQTVNPIPPNVVDWVLVQLRDKDSASIIVASRSAFVLNSGMVVDLDGISSVSFSSLPDDYYVVVIHRNHLPTMSTNPVTLSLP